MLPRRRDHGGSSYDGDSPRARSPIASKAGFDNAGLSHSLSRQTSRPGPKEEPVEDPVKPWGISEKHKDWNDVQKKLQLQKLAHDSRFVVAKMKPGIREFINPHEMLGLQNNWDRQMDNITAKSQEASRRTAALGHRAELRNEELRAVYPVIQRLLWTKWSGWEIWKFSMLRSMPSQAIYRNVLFPSKSHRCIVSILYVSVLTLMSSIMLFFPAPIDEQIEATKTPVWDLLAQLLTLPFGGETSIPGAPSSKLPHMMVTLLVTCLAVVAAHCVKTVHKRLFFSFKLALDQPPPATIEDKREQLRFWHDLAEMGKWVGICIVAIIYGLVLLLCAVQPQPRAAYAVRVFLVAWVWAILVWPLIKATFFAYVLTSARKGRKFDGLLSAFPGIMDFVDVGVKTPEFLTWRIQKIVHEEDLMRKVYNVVRQGGDFNALRDEDLEEAVAGIAAHKWGGMPAEDISQYPEGGHNDMALALY